MNLTRPALLLSLLVGLAPAVGFAHDGPRVWVAQQNGTLVTETSDDDYDPSTYWPSQVFPAELSPYFGTYTTQFPGYEAPRDGSGGVTDGTSIGFNIAGPLLTLNDGADRLVPTSERFAGQSSIPQLGITFPDVPLSQAADYTRYTSAGVVPGYTFTTQIQEHVHLAYTFLGDGASATAAGPDGTYVLPMVLTSSSLARSNWYFLVFNKGGTDAQMQAATSIATTMANVRGGDSDFNGRVDFADLLTLARHYGQTSDAWYATGDFDFNGKVDFADLLTLAHNYGTSASTFTADWSLAQSLVPEPTSMIVLAAVALIAPRRRKA